MGSHAIRARPPSPPPDAASSILDALRKIVRHLRVFARDSERASGLGAAQLFVMSRLAASDASSIRELAARTMTDPSSVSVVVSKLVRGGFVRRTADRGDARRQRLALTAKGHRALAAAPVTPQAQLVDALSRLPPAKLRAIVASLDTLVEAIGAESSDATLFFQEETPTRSRRGARDVG